MIAAMIAILLQSGTAIGVALNTHAIKENEKSLVFVIGDYVPLWFMEGIIQNMNFQTEEIVATISNNIDKVKEINKKYLEFQKLMLKTLSEHRGGEYPIMRSGTVTIDDLSR